MRKIFSAMKPLRRVVGELRFRSDYKRYIRSPSRRTDMISQGLLRDAFLLTRGQATRWAYSLQKAKTPHSARSVSSPLFPDCRDEHVTEAVAALHTLGFFVLPQRLPEAWLAATRDSLSRMRVANRSDENDAPVLAEISPRGPTYWHHEADLAAVPELRSFVSDPVLCEIVGRYLECVPVFDFATAWWSFPSPTGEADTASAQLYHFDMDRVRWVKVFCYLTDVGEENGPHAFVAGSHNTIQHIVTHDGRYTDSEVFAHYPRSAEVRFTGPAGTVFLEDTLGFHKGIPVAYGRRGVFEFEYSINHYGYPHADLWHLEKDANFV